MQEKEDHFGCIKREEEEKKNSCWLNGEHVWKIKKKRQQKQNKTTKKKQTTNKGKWTKMRTTIETKRNSIQNCL